MVYNGVVGVSETIAVQPSAAQAGQVVATNAATGTTIAIIDYLLNTNIVVNGSSPVGTVGDTDSLILRGTDPANPATSGQDAFDVNFTRTGTAGDEVVRVTDAVGGAALYNLQSVTNFNTLAIEMLGGVDTATAVGRNDVSLTINVDGEPGGGKTRSRSPGHGERGRHRPGHRRPGGRRLHGLRCSRCGGLHAGQPDPGRRRQLRRRRRHGGRLRPGLRDDGGNNFDVLATTALSGRVCVDAFPTVGYANLGTGTGGTFSRIDLVNDTTAAGGALDSAMVTGTTGADAYTWAVATSTAAALRLTTGGGTATSTCSGSRTRPWTPAPTR